MESHLASTSTINVCYAFQARTFQAGSYISSNERPYDDSKEGLAGQPNLSNVRKMGEDIQKFDRDLATRTWEITTKADNLGRDLGTRTGEITTKVDKLDHDLALHTGEIATKVTNLGRDLATRTGEITTKVDNLDRDSNTKSAGLEKHINQVIQDLDRHIGRVAVKFSNSIDELQASQSDLKTSQKQLSTDLQLHQQKLSADLSSISRELDSKIGTSMRGWREDFLARENTFLVRAMGVTVLGIIIVLLCAAGYVGHISQTSKIRDSENGRQKLDWPRFLQ